MVNHNGNRLYYLILSGRSGLVLHRLSCRHVDTHDPEVAIFTGYPAGQFESNDEAIEWASRYGAAGARPCRHCIEVTR